MPIPSHQVLTLSLIVECQLEQESQKETNDTAQSASFHYASSRLIALPTEIRLKILRYVLLFDHNSQTHTRRLPHDSIDHLLHLDSRRILEAPHFKHKGRQEINGVLPTFTTCHIDPTVLRVCKALHYDGSSVLYNENMVAAVQSSISGLGSRLRNYGIRVWGPIEARRVAGSGTVFSTPRETTAKITDSPAAFHPLITFRGQNAKPESSVYICKQKEVTHLLHALWILIKCPFARGMKFTVHVAPTARYRLQHSMDAIIRFALLPWMHNHVEKITASADVKTLSVWTNSLETHRRASIADPNVYTYNVVCSYLEQLMSSAEKAIDQKAYLRAETLHELVCYEACSIVRTRTGKLVDVSTKTKEGINRVCKLIAISAYRLTELRSGAIEVFRTVRNCTCPKLADMKKKDVVNEPADATEEATPSESAVDAASPTPIDSAESAANAFPSQASTSPSNQATAETADQVLSDPTEDPNTDSADSTSQSSTEDKTDEVIIKPPIPSCPVHRRDSKPFDSVHHPKTTRLLAHEAIDHAILSALLAFRLPCACPVHEWNLRLNIMLLYLFNIKHDAENARICLKRTYITAAAVFKEAKAKGKLESDVKGEKWRDLEGLVERLKTNFDKDREAESKKGKGWAKRRREKYFRIVEDCEAVVRRVLGERLTPRKGYQGLIWTFRWA